MIADIKGKISRSGSNLTENSEDNLTGNVFGALRYIPFNKVMKPILANTIFPREVADCIEKIDVEYWGDNIKFWPYHEKGELDVIIEFEEIIIGIEVKYRSGISSDDNVYNQEEDEEKSEDFEDEKSINQLARESEIINELGAKKVKLLILIAPEQLCSSLYGDVINRKIINKEVKLAYITWQRFFHEISCLSIEDKYNGLIVEDIKELLKRKGFEQFKDMNIDIPTVIDPLKHFYFDYIPMIQFDFNINIEGELYYEFK
ncbi:MAG: hypothetical protein BWX78_01227 [Firmicutes bacterium ADurb.Bin099]|nr:MAG: hypothetical protein BWX78_01227 [Firmicutes bacterium ADurb.Bin099]